MKFKLALLTFLFSATAQAATTRNIVAATISNGAGVFNIPSTSITANRACRIDGTGTVNASTTTDAELGYVAGVTSAIQNQINAKQATITDGSLTLARTAGTATQIPYAGAGNNLESDPAFTFNDTTKAVSATTFIGALTGNASGTSASFTGNLTGPITSTGMTTAIADGAIATTKIAGTSTLVPYFDSSGFMGTDSAFTFTDSTKALSATIYNIGSANGLSFPADSTATGASVAIGPSALVHQGSLASTAFSNTAVGYQTLASATMTAAAVKNTAIGYQAGTANTSGANNTSLGYQAGAGITSGGNNVYIGYQAGSQSQVATSSGNIGIGYQAGQYATAGNNIFLGYGTGGQAGTSGIYNTALGANALSSSNSGSYNIALGDYAGWDKSTATSNSLWIGNTSVGSFGVNDVYVESGNAAGANWHNAQQFSGALTLSSTVAIAKGVAMTGYDYQTPVTTATVVIPTGIGEEIINPAGTIAAMTLTLPSSPVDGFVVGTTFSQIITSLTVNAPASATVLGAPSAATVGLRLRCIYKTSITTWFCGY